MGCRENKGGGRRERGEVLGRREGERKKDNEGGREGRREKIDREGGRRKTGLIP